MYKFLKIVLVLGLVLNIMDTTAFCQEHTHKHPEAVTQATPQLGPDEVVVTGKIICLGCTLKKEKGAKAQCALYGHTNAIILEKVINSKGNHLLEAEGKIYQFLHNEQSDKLITDHSFEGKTVIITGKIYPQGNILEVNFYKEKEEKEVR